VGKATHETAVENPPFPVFSAYPDTFWDAPIDPLRSPDPELPDLLTRIQMIE
jgi:hypothetical protein